MRPARSRAKTDQQTLIGRLGRGYVPLGVGWLGFGA